MWRALLPLRGRRLRPPGRRQQDRPGGVGQGKEAKAGAEMSKPAQRRHHFPRRPGRVNIRLSEDEAAAIEEAAAQATPFCPSH